MFASTGTKADVDGTKDSMANIRETGVFCVNIVEYAMRDAMNASSATLPHGADEFGHAGIEKASCDQINCARVATAPASLECRMTQMVKIEGENNFVVFGEVVGVHMRDDCIKDGRFDVTTYQPLSRLGYRDYARVTDVFEIIRPDD
ncbi:hypothetical protein Sulfitobl28_25720 [Sulfitobacter pontiacus]|nr:hypothetical protein Sulfitobl28_25720 [Sulfitobacter pontiacus]